MGYKVYCGTTSGSYGTVFDVGNTTSYQVNNLTGGTTYYFAVTAYDQSWNESAYSIEETFMVADQQLPTISNVVCENADQVRIIFNEPIEELSAEIPGNYQIDGGDIVVQQVTLEADLKTVTLITTLHSNGSHQVIVSGVRDRAAVPNTIANGQFTYSWDGSDSDPPIVVNVNLDLDKYLVVTFNEPVEPNSATNLSNYMISPAVNIIGSSINGTFKIVYLTTEPHVPGQSYSMTISNVRDGSGNIMNPVTEQYSCYTEDAVAPRLIAAHCTFNGTTVELEFNEDLDESSAELVSNYTISPAVTIYSAILNPSNRTLVTLNTDAHSQGSYTITVQGVGDDANPPNTIGSTNLNYTFVPPDMTPPTLENVAINSVMGDQLKVRFSEPVTEASSAAIGNYRIEPAVTITRVDALIGRQEVILITDIHPNGDYQLIVNNIQDEAGNFMQANTSWNYSYSSTDIFPPELEKAEYLGKTLVKLYFNESLDPNSVSEISHYSINPSINIFSATLTGSENDQVYLETSEHASSQWYIVSVHSIRDNSPNLNAIPQSSSQQASYQSSSDDGVPPKLVSANLKGGSDRILELTFNEALDDPSVRQANNYQINPSVSVREIELNSTFDKIILTTDPHQRGQNYTITVTGVKDLNNNTIDIDNQAGYTCVVEDQEPPILERLTLDGNQKLYLYFNEPLDANTALNEENYQIDNGISILKAELLTQKLVTLTTTEHTQEGIYTLTVSGLQDQATPPNQMNPINKTYTYSIIDIYAPVFLDAQILSETMVELTFNKSLAIASALDTNNYTINNNIHVLGAVMSAANKVIIETSPHKQGSYTITVNHIESKSGIEIQSHSMKSYTYAIEDKELPQIQSVICYGTSINVKFTEYIEQASGLNSNNYVIKEGIVIRGVDMPENDLVVLTTDLHPPGVYNLTVNGVRDASPQKNSIVPYTQIKYFYDPTDTTGPELVKVDIYENNRLLIVFNEAVNAYDAQNTANYIIVPSVTIKLAVPDASDFMRVWLTTESHDPGTYTLTVSNLNDRAFTPNPIGSMNHAQYTYTPADTVPPELVNCEAKAQQLLTLTFDEQLAKESAENIEHYTITSKGSNIQVREASLLYGGKEVHLETDPHKADVEYSIQILNITDRAPSPNKVVSPIHWAYQWTVGDTSKPKLKDYKLRHPNLLELVFDEPLDQESAENTDNYQITPDVIVLNARLEAEYPYQRVELETTEHMPNMTYRINVRNIKDRALIPNTIDPNTWRTYQLPLGGPNAIDVMSPNVARVDVISETRLDIIFSEPVSKSSAQEMTNYLIEDSVQVKSAEMDTNRVLVHITTTPHQSGKPYQIWVSNVKDCAAAPNIMKQSIPIKYMISSGLSLSNVNREAYRLNLFNKGNLCYIDRDYTIDQAPEILRGTIQIVTANDDKCSNDDGFLMFELNQDATIYIAYDNRISNIPDWLSKWKPTGEQIINSRLNVFDLYSKTFRRGRVILGGNDGPQDDNMYMIFARPLISGGSLITYISKAIYQLAHIRENEQPYYIDRAYTISSIPDSMQSLVWIQTANDDKMNRDENFLRFQLNRKSRVYVGYDKRIASLPKWLVDWERFEGQIVDIRGTKFDVYSKECESGEVVLGGNCGSAEDNMYVVLIKPLEPFATELQELPGYFTLMQNYPNPFNPETKIQYRVHKPGHVTLTIYNILGQQVKVLVDKEVVAGYQDVAIWDGKDISGRQVASGVYFYRIRQEDFAKTKRMILMR